MMSVIMLGVIILYVIMLSVVVPPKSLLGTNTVAYMHDVSDKEKGLITITPRSRALFLFCNLHS